MGNIDEIEDFDGVYGIDDNQYFDYEDYYEVEYPDEKDGERTENTIVIDELDGIDFSSLVGDFKTGLKKITKQSDINVNKITSIVAPTNRKVTISGKTKPLSFFEDSKKTKTSRTPAKKIVNSLKLNKEWGKKNNSKGSISVPSDREVIINGVNQFILDKQDCGALDLKSIGYCNGKKLKEMVFIINNEGNIDFTAELFNPSTPMDYYQATSQNINDKISVAGQGVDGVQYTDVLSHMMSNPTRIINSRITITAPDNNKLLAQRNINFGISQKDLRAYIDTTPINIPQLLDKFQFQSNIIAFNFAKELNRPYVPDGMDILRYTVLAGCTVSIAFYYEQKMLKKYFYKDMRDNKMIF